MSFVCRCLTRSPFTLMSLVLDGLPFGCGLIIPKFGEQDARALRWGAATGCVGSDLPFFKRFLSRKRSQTRFVRGTYSAQIPGTSGVFSVSVGLPVYIVARIYRYVSLSRTSSSSSPMASKICLLSRSDDAISTIPSGSSGRSARRRSARESE